MIPATARRRGDNGDGGDVACTMLKIGIKPVPNDPSPVSEVRESGDRMRGRNKPNKTKGLDWPVPLPPVSPVELR